MNSNNISPVISKDYSVGAILVNSWGYDQTNIDFYCIIKVSGDWLTVLPMMKSRTEETQYRSRENFPTKIVYTEKPMRKKLKRDRESNVPVGFSFGNYSGAGWCRLWNGKPAVSTHYA